jgi:galactoside 2-L-fucosyltransferase 1/2
VEHDLRRYLKPTSNASEMVRRFFADIRPSRWTTILHKEENDESPGYQRIGIHIRAGDTLSSNFLRVGFTVPHRIYYERAMRRVIVEVVRSPGTNPNQAKAVTARIQFIVATDSVQWVKEEFNLSSIAADIAGMPPSSLPPGVAELDIDLVYSTGHEPMFDMLMLSMCDAVVMSTGSFGWWSAWLANKTTVYYSGWPRKESQLESFYEHGEFFPPDWIGINGPHLTF